jgi:D-alanyl-D-alanine carboxypeptidase
MIKNLVAYALFFFTTFCSFAQTTIPVQRLDSLFAVNNKQFFNGVVYIVQHGKVAYQKQYGSSNLHKKIPFKFSDRFVIGSVSKQITATIVLREMEKGHLQLQDVIGKYLPDLIQSWKDSVTIHHLLTHTHGITAVDKSLSFRPGAQFAYGNLGYQLLADIVAKASGQSFVDVSAGLFKLCKMDSSSHPAQYARRLKGFSIEKDGELSDNDQFPEGFTPAGGFISTAPDLVKWNHCLHGGMLLSAATYKLMITVYASREHPLLGLTEYGYGPTISKVNGLLRIGQTGLVPGFVSMNYYYPATKTSVVMLENMEWNPENTAESFYYHLEVLKIVGEALVR